MPEIRVEKLNFSYKVNKKHSNHIINDLDIIFPSNKINVIVGPSGCGKTTLLKSIIGLEQYQGNIYFDNINVNYLSIKDRNVSYVNQNITLFEHLTAFENIAFPLKLLHASDDEIRTRVKELSDILNIGPCLSRLPKQLSIGQCQRVLIAKALIKRPLVCIFDEPFSSLDKAIAENLIEELKVLFKQMNTTVIFVSHDALQAFQIADYIYVMDEGKIIASGDKESIIYNQDSRVKELLKY